MLDVAIDWLLSPIDPARAHAVDGLTSWHARSMVMAWGILIPLGVLIARYFKVLPHQDWPRELDNKTWWHSHLLLQWTGAALTMLGLCMIVTKVGGNLDLRSPHHLFGWITVTLLVLQILAGIFRGTTGGPTQPAPNGSLRGDHFDMTTRRKVFEVVHKTGGYLAIGFGAAAIISGLWHANAPNWMWITIGSWWILMISAFVLLQIRNRAFDTYQAIWGPSPDLPGNRIKPIGFGIRRHD